MKRILLVLTLIAAFASNMAAQNLVLDYPTLSEKFDTIFVDFKVVADSGNKIKLGAIDTSSLKLKEIGYNGNEDITLIDVQDIRNYDQDYVSDNYSIVVIVDRSVSQECLEAQRTALTELFQGFPKAHFYVTAMEAERTPTVAIQNSYQLQTWMDSCFSQPTTAPKFIYKSMASVIEEIIGNDVHDFYPEVEYNPALRDQTKKTVIMFTDGKYMSDKGAYVGGEEFFHIKEALRNGLDPDHKVWFNHVYFGEDFSRDAFQNELQYVSKQGDEFYPKFDLQLLKDNLILRYNPDSMDYRMVILNPPHKLYDGQKITLEVNLDADGVEASGIKLFTMGSLLHPLPAKANHSDRVNLMVRCIIFGLVIVILLYLIFRIVVPRVQHFVFKKKYVKQFTKPNILPIDVNDYVAQKCYFCKDEFVPGDEIVTKCEHTMHYDCWKQNGHQCPEYGKECHEGRFFYNEDNPWDKRNIPFYLKNMLVGAFVGIFTWLVFRWLTVNTLFIVFIQNLVILSGKVGIDATGKAFTDKIHDLLFFGVIVGFFITLVGSWLVERRKKTIHRILMILLRGVLGALAGFFAGLIGSLVAIAAGTDYNCFIVDIIPWLLLGLSLGFVMSYKTKVSVKRAVIAGLAFAMLGFCVLYLFNFDDSDLSFQYIGLLVSILCMLALIIFASGLYACVAVPEKRSEHYFLHIEGTPKTRDVAIYKWMNRVGGYRVVTIGKSEKCYIDMDWDDSPEIEGVQAEVYVEKDVSYCKMLADNKAIRLSHGTSFKIGKTVFTYIETDCI